jgi:ATP-dependent Clp protease ATP-binding subunit ClpX
MGSLFRQCEPDDLIQFGLIPELVGRLPVIVGLDELDADALMQILTQPKNALVKQFGRLFEMENIELKFEEGALQAIVKQTLVRKTGARGLRSVMERVLQQPMFDLPGTQDVSEFVVTAEMVESAMLPESDVVAKPEVATRKATRKKVA